MNDNEQPPTKDYAGMAPADPLNIEDGHINRWSASEQRVTNYVSLGDILPPDGASIKVAVEEKPSNVDEPEAPVEPDDQS